MGQVVWECCLFNTNLILQEQTVRQVKYIIILIVWIHPEVCNKRSLTASLQGNCWNKLKRNILNYSEVSELRRADLSDTQKSFDIQIAQSHQKEVVFSFILKKTYWTWDFSYSFMRMFLKLQTILLWFLEQKENTQALCSLAHDFL